MTPISFIYDIKLNQWGFQQWGFQQWGFQQWGFQQRGVHTGIAADKSAK
jgi:hypothetical protein